MNWMRENCRSSTWPRVLTASVLARPGTPSTSRCPRQSSATIIRSTRPRCPTMTFLTSAIAAWICSASSRTASFSLATSTCAWAMSPRLLRVQSAYRRLRTGAMPARLTQPRGQKTRARSPPPARPEAPIITRRVPRARGGRGRLSSWRGGCGRFRHEPSAETRNTGGDQAAATEDGGLRRPAAGNRRWRTRAWVPSSPAGTSSAGPPRWPGRRTEATSARPTRG